MLWRTKGGRTGSFEQSLFSLDHVEPSQLKPWRAILTNTIFKVWFGDQIIAWSVINQYCFPILVMLYHLICEFDAIDGDKTVHSKTECVVI